MSNGIQDPTSTEQAHTDTPMEEQLDKGKGKAPAQDDSLMEEDDDEDESEEDDEVRSSCNIHFPLHSDLISPRINESELC